MRCSDFALKQREILNAQAVAPLPPQMLGGRSQNTFYEVISTGTGIMI
jgi:hypothetical protein